MKYTIGIFWLTPFGSLICFCGVFAQESVAFGSSRHLGSNPRGQVVVVSFYQSPRLSGSLVVTCHHASVVPETHCSWLYLFWWWIHLGEILLFRDFDLYFDLKVGTFLSFCWLFAKLDVGISLGLDLLSISHFLVCDLCLLNLTCCDSTSQWIPLRVLSCCFTCLLFFIR